VSIVQRTTVRALMIQLCIMEGFFSDSFCWLCLFEWVIYFESTKSLKNIFKNETAYQFVCSESPW